MRKLKTLVLTACIGLLSISAIGQKHDGYIFKGKIEGLNDGSKLFLRFFDERTMWIVA